MKRFLILVATLILAVCLLAGCSGGVKTYINPTEAINVGVNQDFIIALDSNPTTGYSWEESYDSTLNP